MKNFIKVAFIGSGNVAWHLAPAIDNATGFKVIEIYSPTEKNAKALVNRLYEAEVKTDLDFSDSEAQLFFFCIKDDGIEALAKEIILPENAIVIHNSGSLPITVLAYAATARMAVLYPLQTFSKQKKVNIEDVPFFVETIGEGVEEIMVKLANQLSQKVAVVNSQKRMALHIAAVFASNFTNHMLTISKTIMDASDLPYTWLTPLISETINKSFEIGPLAAQTGPAKRGDLKILDQHLSMLQEDEQIAEIYKLVSQHIIDVHDVEED